MIPRLQRRVATGHDSTTRPPAPQAPAPDHDQASPADAAGHPPSPPPRAAPDRLDAVLARAVQQRVTRPTLQRVGGTKFSVVTSDTASKQSVADLKAALAAIRKTRQAHKQQLEADLKSGRGHIGDYPAELDDGTANPMSALMKTEPFAAKRLKAAGAGTAGEIRDKDDNLVAKVALGLGAFSDTTVADAPEGQRKTFTRDSGDGAKQYVADDCGVPTRRYAYVEKSIHQFVELSATGAMAGRYQRLHEALGDWDPGKLKKIAEHESEIIVAKGTSLVTTLTPAQLAVLHQWTGSGTTQRGLSLTSTPRENAVYGNAGESFREATGVRIKIDLLKVPKNVVLLNHYASGGIKDKTAKVNPDLVTSSDVYKTGYRASVIKNRELYLERLDSDWIEDIDVHDGAANRPKKPDETGKRGAALVAAVAANAGVADYIAGFKASVDAGPEADPPDKLSPAGTLGFASGQTYLMGHSWGKEESDRFVSRGLSVRSAITKAHDYEYPAPQPVRGSKHRAPVKKITAEQRAGWALQEANRLHPSNPSNPYQPKDGSPEFLAARIVCSTMKQHGYAAMKRIDMSRWLALSTISKEERDHPGIYWVGWAHAAAGKAPRNAMSQLFTV